VVITSRMEMERFAALTIHAVKRSPFSFAIIQPRPFVAHILCMLLPVQLEMNVVDQSIRFV